MIPGNANPLLLASAADGAAAAAGLIKSVRFNDDDSAYLNRTPSGAGDRQTFTWSGWIKRSEIGSIYPGFFGAGANTGANGYFMITIEADEFRIFIRHSSGTWNFYTNALLRDTSAWYHIVVAIDTTAASSSDRAKVYINGVEQTFRTSATITQNYNLLVNTAVEHTVGAIKNSAGTTSGFFPGYMADVYLIDGSALDATSFGAFDDSGVWQAAAYSGTFGTNGFHLFDFANESTVGNDSSGNENDFTANNISTTAGAGNDVLFDVPTNGTQTDTGAGGEVSGNYVTFNPLRSNESGYNEAPKNGNLETNPRGDFTGTIPVTSGKWYWEVEITTVTTSGQAYIGVLDVEQIQTGGSRAWATSQIAAMRDTGDLYGDGKTGSGVSYGQGDVLGFALDASTGKLWIAKNNTWINSGNPANGTGHAFSGLSYSAYTLIVSDGNTGQVYTLNAGQRAFSYTAPTNFLSICTTNLSTPTIADGSNYFDTKLWTGNGSTQTISGLKFSPDLVWIKSRSGAFAHLLFDQIRGTTKYLSSNTTSAEGTDSNSLTAFTSDGFSVGTTDAVNQSGGSLVAWAWDAGSSTVSNTDGSITSSVRANQTAGFSIISVSVPSISSATIGHGLNTAPAFYIWKDRDTNSTFWYAYHASLGATKYILLQSNSAATTFALWNNTEPTNSVISIGSALSNSGSAIIYAMAPVAGYSAFGSYTGNNSVDGPCVHLGFKPAFILIKCSSGTGSWMMFDTARDTFNVARKGVAAQLNFAETGNEFDSLDIVSNGFKIRNTSASFNSFNSPTYIYAAFAENPFQANGGLAR